MKKREGTQYVNSADAFQFGYASMPYIEGVKPHFHNCYELLLLQKGDIGYMVENNYYDMEIGDLIITNPKELHHPVFHSHTHYERSLIFLKPVFLAEFVTSGYDPFSALERRKIGTQNKIPAQTVHRLGLDEKIAVIGQLAQKHSPEHVALIKSHLLQLLSALNHIVVAELKGSPPSKAEEILDYINRNVAHPITLDDLAEHFYLNKYHIAHLFKEKTGLTFHEYMICKRVLLAKELIMEGMPLALVCEETGFGDYSSFYRSFRKILGSSPSEFSKTAQ